MTDTTQLADTPHVSKETPHVMTGTPHVSKETPHVMTGTPHVMTDTSHVCPDIYIPYLLLMY